MPQKPSSRYKPPAGSVVVDAADLSDAPVAVSDTDLTDGFDWATLLDQNRRPAGEEAQTPSRAGYYSGALDFLLGALKGVGSSAVNLGGMARAAVGADTSAFSDAAKSSLGLDTTNGAQDAGRRTEQLLEFLAPGVKTTKVAGTVAANARPLVRAGLNLAKRAARDAAGTAAVSAVQGGDPVQGAVAGAGGQVAYAGLGTVGRAIGRQAVPLVRAAIKPALSDLKQIAGASVEGLNAQANKLARFILDNKISTSEQASAIIRESEQALADLLKVKNPTTDAPQRVMRYLDSVRRSAAKQGLPAEDVAVIEDAARQIVEQSSFGKTVTREVMKDSPSGLLDAAGKRVQVPVKESTRVLRDDMTASEAIDTARATSKWDTRRSYGEQKSASKEASKATERAARDAAKTALPEARPILARESQAITARKALDRMQVRAGNRDAVSLPAHVMAAGEVASGRVPVLAFAANWLRNNQLKAGHIARSLEQAIERRDEISVLKILERLGVARAAETAPATSGASLRGAPSRTTPQGTR